MIEIVGEVGKPATEEEIKRFLYDDADCGNNDCEGTCVCANARNGEN